MMTMDQVPQQHPLQDLIPDYLNEHLAADERSRFETAMAQDESLRNLVSFERKVQAAVSQPAAQTAGQPRFSDIEHQLTKSSWWQFNWQVWAVPTAAAFVFMAAVMINTPRPQDDYETLTQPPAYTAQVLRIVANGPDELDSIVDEYASKYELEVRQRYPGLHSIDVAPAGTITVQALAAELNQDPRVSFTEQINTEGAPR